MEAKIIDGKRIADSILLEISNRIKNFDKKPGLAIILVGDNYASEVYVNTKKKRCSEIGINCDVYRFDKNTNEKEVISLVNRLNNDKGVNGIIVQLPLPGQIDERKVINSILPEKDVDGLTSSNLGKNFWNENLFLPATASACFKLVKTVCEDLRGKRVVLVGSSNLVGKPLSILFINENATVSVCNRHTNDLGKITKEADILVVATGNKKLIKKDMVKGGCIVIDVGINRTSDGIVGDVDYQGVKDIVGYITPVPGGVGPMTVAMLLENVVRAFELQKK